MPIFQEIAKRKAVQFHVLQFTWADEKKISQTKSIAKQRGIQYTALPVLRKPNVSAGSLLTVFTSVKKIKRYIQEHQIDVVMPRSTFPAMMVNSIKNKTFKILFDADGLPIEERVDFAGLQRNSYLYRFLKFAETKMLQRADAVITRSQKAIDIHVATIGDGHSNKFSVVYNGRDPNTFKIDVAARSEARKSLGIESEFLFVYAGSLGPQYCFPEMLRIFSAYVERHSAHLLILTGNLDFAKSHIPSALQSKITLKKVDSAEVPLYLNAADLAFALRQPSFSMQGVAPIKLGEYLLCGLPVIASKGIGDTEKILENFENCYLYDHQIDIEEQLPKITAFAENAIFADRIEIRENAKQFFSLEAAAKSYIGVLEKIKNGK